MRVWCGEGMRVWCEEGDEGMVWGGR
jgi:hypothetical protein